MSNPNKRQRIPSQAHLTNIHIPAEEGVIPYHAQLIAKINELFAADPEATELLIGIDILSFGQRTDEQKLVQALKSKGISYQVVRFGGKTGKDTGVLVTRKKPEVPAITQEAPDSSPEAAE